ncbi:MAG: hypothetical protein KF819_36845 [Labilithrix sp.]|nr:hypothetical protein [Labilithrix sp.]
MTSSLRPFATFATFACSLGLASSALVACGGYLDVGNTDQGASVRAVAARAPAVVALGTGHGCAILEDHTVACWGFNSNGQTGVKPDPALADAPSGQSVRTPAIVPGLADVVQISAGWQSTYALRKDGKVFGWGATRWTPGNSYEGGEDGHVPKEVPGVSDIVKVGDGGGPVCALRKDGRVVCWGRNTYKSVGPSSLPDDASPPASLNDVLPPTIVEGITDAIDITVGDSMSCARHRDLGVSCWGRVQLVADRWTPDDHVPVRIPGVRDAVQVAVAQGAAIALLKDGTVVGWGDSGDQGLLFHIHGPRDPRVTSYDDGVPPAPFPDLNGVVAIDGQYHTMCALKGDGALACWGRNDVGELGQGRTTTPLLDPQPIAGVVAEQIAVGTWNTCAVRPEGDLVCWGGGSSDALGTGRDELYAAKPDAPVRLPKALARPGDAVP